MPGSAALRPERVLLYALRAGLALLLLTPLVVTPTTAYPFVVGKALYARTLIEVVFVLWVWLALAQPAWRPPRSWLLVLLGAGLGVATLAAVFGVSVQHSVWSGYERMQGLVDLAHWFALALVLVSVLRSARAWRVFLGLNVGVSLGVALVGIAGYHGVALPFFGELPERNFPRIGATLGNAAFLGGYLQVNFMLALGLLARACRRPPAPAPAAPARGKSVRQRPSPRRPGIAPTGPWAARLWFAGAALLNLWALTLSASFGALAGLGAGLGFLAVLAAWRARQARPGAAPRTPGDGAVSGNAVRQARPGALVAMGLLGAGALVLVLVLVVPAPRSELSFSNPLLQRLALAGTIESTLRKRVASWEAGLKGLAARPLLGWGPANYVVPFGRYAAGLGATMHVHDQAHSQLIETAATTGLLGLVAYLALWGYACRVIVRAVLAGESGETVLALFAGAALAGYFVQSQTLFSTASSALQQVVLLAFVAYLETSVRGRAPAPRLPRRAATALAAPLRHPLGRVSVALAALALGGAGLVANGATYGAARDLYRAETSGQFMRYLARAITGFEPLAGFPRTVLFENLAQNWAVLHRTQRAEALRLLAWAEVEAAAALRAAPEDWRLHHALARMYHALAATSPAYAGRARRQLERARALAPNLDVLAPARPQPGPRLDRPGRPRRGRVHGR